MLLCLLLALYGIEQARRRPAFGLAVVAGLVGLLLVKGVLVVTGFAACVLWLAVRGHVEPSVRNRTAWAALLAALVAVAATATVYEYALSRGHGRALLVLLSRPSARRRGGGSVRGGNPAEGLQPGLVPGARALVPVSLEPDPRAGRADDAGRSRAHGASPWLRRLLPRSVQPTDRHADPTRPAARRALRGLGFALLYLGAFSLSDRRADRYLSPARPPQWGPRGSVVARRAWPRLQVAAEQVLSAGGPGCQPPSGWRCTVVHILAGRLGVPTIKVWAPDS